MHLEYNIMYYYTILKAIEAIDLQCAAIIQFIIILKCDENMGEGHHCRGPFQCW